jgi:hypothetical protein
VLVGLLLLLLATTPSHASVNCSSGGNAGANFADTVSVANVTPSGSDRALYAIIGWGTNPDTVRVSTSSPPTFNGSGSAIALTRVHEAIRPSSTLLGVDVWRLTGPAASIGSVAVTMTGAVSSRLQVAIVLCSGVDAVDPDDTPVTATAIVNPGPQPTLNDVPSAASDFVIDAIMSDSGAAHTQGTGQTIYSDTGGNALTLSASGEAGSGDVDMTWSGFGTFTSYLHVAFNVNAAAGGGGGPGPSRPAFSPFGGGGPLTRGGGRR